MQILPMAIKSQGNCRNVTDSVKEQKKNFRNWLTVMKNNKIARKNTWNWVNF